MRAERLIAVLLLLQTRERITVAEVARELEVSPRTARRDLEALGMAGVPVYSSAGRGGGWSLVGGARTDLSGLTVDEAKDLFLAAGPSAAGAPGAQTALRKLLAALPAQLRRGAEAASAAVVVDAATWGRTSPPEPPFLADLRRAVLDQRQVVLGYTGREGEQSSRPVSPLGLVVKSGVWYLLAGTAAGVRTFRVGRVTAVMPTDDAVLRPEGFDLAAAWQESSAAVEARRGQVRVSGSADPELLPVLRARLGRRLTVGGADADGWVPVEVAGPSVGMLVSELAGYGARFVVVGPAEARARLAEVAAELVQLYGDQGTEVPAG
ncbi:helix-turn-helix transcriptional regulator [Blastococcus litoris]|uniref:helix-turn-helix transcriptional regulator n=1 Tax=Blastococcus litoris TaxID=2171622 RepID=UPI0013DF064F|nr:YafY family protein [Blastococcus litoris]